MFKKMICFVAVVGLVLALAPAAQAQLVPVGVYPGNPYVPSGVSEGDQFRLVFVTDGVTPVTDPDINYYNDFVTAQANTVPALQELGTTWMVIGSTESVNARTNTVTDPDVPDASAPIYRLDGALVATGNATLWNTWVDPTNPTGAPLANPVNITQSDAVYLGNVVTGVGWDGIGGHRSLGRVVDTHVWPIWGHSDRVDTGWMQVGDSPGGNLHVYAMSGIFTVNPLGPGRTWTATSTGLWNDDANWLGDAPSGNDMSANFADAITADTTVVIESANPVTIKDISFDNANRYSIAGTGSLTLEDVDATLATIEVAQGTHEFQVPVTLGSDAEVGVSEAADELIFNNALNLNGFQLEKVGPGLMSINNDLTTGGGSIQVTEGTVGGIGTVGGSLTVAATVAPGNSIGELSVTENVTIEAGGVLATELQGSAGDSDTLAIDGTLTLNGDVQLDWLHGDAATSMFGGTYTVATYASFAGTPSVNTAGNIGAGYTKTALADTGTALEITLQPQGLGDTDLDADVDGDDLATFGLAWSPSGTDKTWFDGDFDFDGDIDGDDLAALGLAWAPGGISFPAGDIEVTSVPEPGTIVMLLLAAAGLLIYRKRR